MTEEHQKKKNNDADQRRLFFKTDEGRKKKEEISRIYNSIPKDQRKEFDQKYENIHRLEQGKFQ